jgi:hypothetical protein
LGAIVPIHPDLIVRDAERHEADAAAVARALRCASR